MTVHWGKRNSHAAQRPLDTGSELNWFQAIQMCMYGPPRQSRGLQRSRNQGCFSSDLPVEAPRESPKPTCIIGCFSTSAMHDWRRHTQTLQKFLTCSLTCGVRAILVEKAKRKPTEQTLPGQIVTHNQYHTSGREAEINATTEDLNYVLVIVPITPSLGSPIWPVQKRDGSWRKTVIITYSSRCWRLLQLL